MVSVLETESDPEAPQMPSAPPPKIPPQTPRPQPLQPALSPLELETELELPHPPPELEMESESEQQRIPQHPKLPVQPPLSPPPQLPPLTLALPPPVEVATVIPAVRIAAPVEASESLLPLLPNRHPGRRSRRSCRSLRRPDPSAIASASTSASASVVAFLVGAGALVVAVIA